MTKKAKVAHEAIKAAIDKAVAGLDFDDYEDVLDELEADIEGRQDGLKSDRANEEEGDEEDDDDDGDA